MIIYMKKEKKKAMIYMENISKTKIISKEYKEIEDEIDSIVLEQDFLKIHKSLVGKY